MTSRNKKHDTSKMEKKDLRKKLTKQEMKDD